MTENSFKERFGSKIEPIEIELPGYEFFHTASSEYEVDNRFIGRKDIGNKLKAWLSSPKKTGVYLITGFRGMGKSSFVGKVLEDIVGYRKSLFKKISTNR